MSNSLIVAAATAALRDILLAVELPLPIDPQGDSTLTGAKVVLLPPKYVSTTAQYSQLNLFLYEIQENPALRNLDVPARTRAGDPEPISLALDLRYLVTAYGKGNDEVLSHRLLGRAMTLLHNAAVLARGAVRNALTGQDAGVQVERMRVTMHHLTVEEMSKLWTMFGTEYRPSVAYQLSVALIDAVRAPTAALPVLDPQIKVAAALGPLLQEAVPPRGQQSALLGGGGLGSSSSSSGGQPGDIVTLRGARLGGTDLIIVLRDAKLRVQLELPPLTGWTEVEARFQLPDASHPAGLVAGPYTVSVIVQQAGSPDIATNEVPLAIAPRLLDIAPNPVNAAVQQTVTVRSSPPVRPEQRVGLLVGGRELRAAARTAVTDLTVFDVRAVVAGSSLARLRVDGVDSLIVDSSVSPPVFDPAAPRLTVT